MLLADRNWLGIAQLWASCGAAFAYTRQAVELEHDDYESPFTRISLWFRRRKFRVVQAADSRPARRGGSEASAPTEEMDRLLDKIAKSGISSLTSAERARLEKARQELLKREGR